MRKVLCSERFCLLIMTESVTQKCSVKKVFLKLHKVHMKTPVPEPLFSLETLAQVFSCEFSEIAKNIFSFRTPSVAASEMRFVFEAGETLPSKRKCSHF